MKWKKLGKVFEPPKSSEWMHSHAALPFAEILDGDHVKIYFSARDRINRSHVGYIVARMTSPDKIVTISELPVIKPGSLGSFDDSGAIGSCLVNVGSKKYLYYVGWNLGVTVPFRNAIGLCISEDGGMTFDKFSEGPILDRNCTDPFFVASCCVIKEDELFRIYYLSCVKWDLINELPRHKYHIKYAESRDGLAWERNGIIAINFKDESEYAISTPRVIKDPNLYKMWYSCRGESYRIGYAESRDGIYWIRKDEEVGIDVSESGWDSEMICYPFVFDHKGQRYMLYNGNGYGKTGFGLAVLQED